MSDESTTTDPDYAAKQRLAAAKAERSRILAARAAREAARSVDDQLEVEERSLRDEQTIEKAECEHGRLGKKIAAVYSDQGVVIVKRPNHLIFQRFQDAGEVTTLELRKLVNPSLVHPALGVFEGYVEEEPALLLRVGNAVAALAGARAKEVSGK